MTQVNNYSIPSLSELYSREYDASMKEWRRIGSIDKATNILASLGAVQDAQPLESVLEVGCGTGDVLYQLAEKKIASRYIGIEIGDVRAQSVQAQNNRNDVNVHPYDGKTIPYPDKHFDFVYATHVLEHVMDERGFLGEMRRVSRRFIYLEVPCELHLRASHRSLQNTLNIGHINSYTPDSFALTLETSGLKVLHLNLFDHSFAVHKFHSSTFAAAAKVMARRSLLKLGASFAPKLFSYHVGALCEPSAPMS